MVSGPDAGAAGTARAPAMAGGGRTELSGGATTSGPGYDQLGYYCALSIKDQAGLDCILASSTPTYRMLHPLGDDFFIEAGTGNVGIGTTTPFGALHVQGSTFLSGYLYLDGDLDGLMALGAWDVTKVGGGLQFNETHFGTSLALAPGGNVGIGTIDPLNRLHLQEGPAGVPPNSDSDLVIESSAEASLNLLSPDGQESALFCGNPSSGSRGGQIVYNPYGGAMTNGFLFRTGPAEAVATHLARPLQAAHVRGLQDVLRQRTIAVQAMFQEREEAAVVLHEHSDDPGGGGRLVRGGFPCEPNRSWPGSGVMFRR